MKPARYRYLKYIAAIVLFFLMIVHLVAYNIRGKENLNFFEKSVLFAAFPVESIINSTTNKINKAWEGYINLIDLKKANESLLKENRDLKGQIIGWEEVKAENERLKKLLKFSEESEAKYVGARVISNGPSNIYHTLIMDKGSEDGIKRGMAVVTAEGVVGQVSYVKGRYCGMITLIDPNSAIDAIDQKTRARGILRGYRSGKLIFKYLPFSEKIDVGDIVVSTGMDGVYPKGIGVGEVESVDNKKESLFQNVIVKPIVDFSRVEDVLINLKITDEGLEGK